MKPPNRVKRSLTQHNVQAFEELKKALNCGWNTLVSMGVHTVGIR